MNLASNLCKQVPEEMIFSMVSGNHKIAQSVCNRLLYTTCLNHKNGSIGIHLNTYTRFKREKGKKRKDMRYETE